MNIFLPCIFPVATKFPLIHFSYVSFITFHFIPFIKKITEIKLLIDNLLFGGGKGLNEWNIFLKML